MKAPTWTTVCNIIACDIDELGYIAPATRRISPTLEPRFASPSPIHADCVISMDGNVGVTKAIIHRFPKHDKVSDSRLPKDDKRVINELDEASS